ncbi:hypothetical protein [Pseudarthrobacter sp. PS3-L1]|uniref:hypothetical protein n=1 Tax=Pseudarthrobacter sp. PS3-L1 TaxID=3046207 RepID=UPI0024B8DCAB|nr:hypothetical protein [Pseudarthrobacter sp. PS3-L1]MDJ0320398.1 hypothetical protein [Pseudarthrobacter sp. PS3-L1]
MTVLGSIKPPLALAAACVVLAVSACSPSASDVPAVSSPATTAQTQAASPSANGPTASAVPTSQSANGSLVQDFPSTLIPLMPSATVKSSSLLTPGGPATAGLVGEIKAEAPAILAFYTQSFESQGFKAVPGDTVEKIPSKDFLRGDSETINVSVQSEAGVSTFTIGATVSGDSIK